MIPGYGAPPPTYFQRLASNPFWNFGANLLAQRSPYLGVNVGTAMQQTAMLSREERNRVLDEKPKQITLPSGEIGFLFPDGRVTNLGLGVPPGEQRAAAREQREAEAAERKSKLPVDIGKGSLFPESLVWDEKTKSYVPYKAASETETPTPPTTGTTPPQGPGTQQPATPAPPAPTRQTQTTTETLPEGPATGSPAGPPVQAEKLPTPPPAPPAQQAQPMPSAGDQQQPPAAQAGAAEEQQGIQKVVQGNFRTPLSPRARQIIETTGGSPETFDFKAQQLAHGDISQLQMGQGKVAAAMKSLLRDRAAQYWIDQGMDPKRANAAIAEFMAQKAGARSLAQQEARITGALGTAMQTAPRVIEASNKVDRTQYPDLNRIILAAKQKTGDPNVVQFGLAIETFVNNYARAMGGGNNVLTDAAREQAHIYLQDRWTKGQINGAIDQALVEMDSELQGVRNSMGAYLGTETQTRYERGDVFKTRPGATQQPGTTAPAATAPQGGGRAGPPTIKSKDEYEKLDPGTEFIDQNGNRWTKPKAQ